MSLIDRTSGLYFAFDLNLVFVHQLIGDHDVKARMISSCPPGQVLD